jgi:hypothetical protein
MMKRFIYKFQVKGEYDTWLEGISARTVEQARVVAQTLAEFYTGKKQKTIFFTGPVNDDTQGKDW